MCSFVVVSIVLYMLERIGTAPARADGPLQQRAPQITIREAFWFIFGSLLQGNTDSSPSTIPGSSRTHIADNYVYFHLLFYFVWFLYACDLFSVNYLIVLCLVKL